MSTGLSPRLPRPLLAGNWLVDGACDALRVELRRVGPRRGVGAWCLRDRAAGVGLLRVRGRVRVAADGRRVTTSRDGRPRVRPVAVLRELGGQVLRPAAGHTGGEVGAVRGPGGHVSGRWLLPGSCADGPEHAGPVPGWSPEPATCLPTCPRASAGPWPGAVDGTEPLLPLPIAMMITSSWSTCAWFSSGR